MWGGVGLLNTSCINTAGDLNYIKKIQGVD